MTSTVNRHSHSHNHGSNGHQHTNPERTDDMRRLKAQLATARYTIYEQDRLLENRMATIQQMTQLCMALEEQKQQLLQSSNYAVHAVTPPSHAQSHQNSIANDVEAAKLMQALILRQGSTSEDDDPTETEVADVVLDEQHILASVVDWFEQDLHEAQEEFQQLTTPTKTNDATTATTTTATTAELQQRLQDQIIRNETLQQQLQDAQDQLQRLQQKFAISAALKQNSNTIHINNAIQDDFPTTQLEEEVPLSDATEDIHTQVRALAQDLRSSRRDSLSGSSLRNSLGNGSNRSNHSRSSAKSASSGRNYYKTTPVKLDQLLLQQPSPPSPYAVDPTETLDVQAMRRQLEILKSECHQKDIMIQGLIKTHGDHGNDDPVVISESTASQQQQKQQDGGSGWFSFGGGPR